MFVFGFGSLMWLPEFAYTAAFRALVPGWHREFTCLSIRAWGTERHPGLSAALHPGGTCLGIAFAIEPGDAAQSLETLRRREAAYRHISVQCRLGSIAGPRVEALSFAANPENGRFLEEIDEQLQVDLIGRGEGPRGTSRFYLESTVHCLDCLGSGSTKAHALLDAVCQADARDRLTASTNAPIRASSVRPSPK